jgi:outer membrane biosynthesis protein TonB
MSETNDLKKAVVDVGSIMGLLQNKTVIHIAVEVVLVAALSFYFYKKTKSLEEQIKTLEAKLKENKVDDINQKIDEIISHKMNILSLQVTQQFQEQHMAIQQRFAQFQELRPRRAQSIVVTSPPPPPPPPPPPKPTKMIVEDTDDLDAELEEELKEITS